MWILVVHRPKRKIRGPAAFKLGKVVCSREGGFWGYSRTKKENLRAHSLDTGEMVFCSRGEGLLITPGGYNTIETNQQISQDLLKSIEQVCKNYWEALNKSKNKNYVQDMAPTTNNKTMFREWPQKQVRQHLHKRRRKHRRAVVAVVVTVAVSAVRPRRGGGRRRRSHRHRHHRHHRHHRALVRASEFVEVCPI